MRYALIFLSAMCIWPAYGETLKWPRLTDPKITSCSNSSGGYCDSSVSYSHSGTGFDYGEPQMSKPTTTATSIRAYGVHCDYGSSVPGYERAFSGCVWRTDTGSHNPTLTGKCQTIAGGSWALTQDSTCATNTTWTGHTGAGPGGECVMFGYMSGSSLYTPYGVISALNAANGGDRFCQKPLPPGVTCDIELPSPLLDHGVMVPTARSVRKINGTVECGTKPKISFVGGDELNLAVGIRTKLTAQLTNATQLEISSDLTTTNAAAGDHRASAVLVVSPW